MLQIADGCSAASVWEACELLLPRRGVNPSVNQ